MGGKRAPLGAVYLEFIEPPELQALKAGQSHRRLGFATALIAAAEGEFYRECGYVDAGLPICRVKERIVLRTGSIDVDDNLVSLTKALP